MHSEEGPTDQPLALWDIFVSVDPADPSTAVAHWLQHYENGNVPQDGFHVAHGSALKAMMARAGRTLCKHLCSYCCHPLAVALWKQDFTACGMLCLHLRRCT